ncbi:hypothetical protein PV327_007848 [Microctonus hyperodae]|uniref:Uncharacterized protein n=1 Tax=Microctonus hyperodae TaxID=165561 RepID=A0AA39KZ52_MICHY|nr:hypothetical protein PV327_007848 [Microctonus hyperodae]
MERAKTRAPKGLCLMVRDGKRVYTVWRRGKKGVEGIKGGYDARVHDERERDGCVVGIRTEYFCNGDGMMRFGWGLERDETSLVALKK